MTIVLLRKFSMVGRMKITWLNDTLHTYIEQYDCQCRFTNAQSIWEFNSKNFVSHFSDVSEWAHFRLRTTMLRGNFEKLPNRTMNYSQCVCATSEINKIWQHRRRKKNVCINSMYAFDSVFLIFDAVAWLGRATLKSGITKTHNVLFATRIFSSFHSFRFLHTELVRDFFFLLRFLSLLLFCRSICGTLPCIWINRRALTSHTCTAHISASPSLPLPRSSPYSVDIFAPAQHLNEEAFENHPIDARNR